MRRKQAMFLLATLLLGAAVVQGQEKPAEKEATGERAEKRPPLPPPIPVALTVLFTEYEGEKKISSLPYTMPVNAHQSGDRWVAGREQLRMGVRVPIVVSRDPNVPQTVQYMDVGTNVDCRARVSEGGQYEVELQVERSSIYSVGAEGKQVEWSPGERLGIAAQPIVRQYRSTMTLLMRDGQTIQRAVATDPVSGRVLKVDVTLNVVK